MAPIARNGVGPTVADFPSESVVAYTRDPKTHRAVAAVDSVVPVRAVQAHLTGFTGEIVQFIFTAIWIEQIRGQVGIVFNAFKSDIETVQQSDRTLQVVDRLFDKTVRQNIAHVDGSRTDCFQ